MKPGRELDMLVAERIMGCKVLRATDTGLSQDEYERRRRWDGGRCGCPGTPHNDSDDEGCYEWLREYSTDIAAAWTVIEKLKNENNYVEVISIVGDKRWICRWRVNGAIYGAGAETAPHAICLAALRAVGVDLSKPS